MASTVRQASLWELHRTGGNRLHSWRAHTQDFMYTRTQDKIATPSEHGYLWNLAGFLGRSRSTVAHCGDKDIGGRGLREYSSSGVFWEVIIVAARPSLTYTTACRLQCWDASGQPTNKGGTQPQASAERLPKVVQRSRPPLTILLDMALPIEAQIHPGIDS